MTRAVATLVALFFILLFTCSAALAEPRLRGTWVGTLHQDPPAEVGDYKVVITFTGSKSAKISYPELHCGGRLRLIKSDDTSKTFREKISGSDCIDNGTVVITVTADDTATYSWIDPDTQRAATCVGTIRRTRE